VPLSSDLCTGFTVLPGVLRPADVTAFVEQIEAELAGSESDAPAAGNTLLYDRADIGCVSLHDRRTWPKGKNRRVVECAPFPRMHGRGGVNAGTSTRGCSSHWNALRTSPALTRTLDRIVGADCWEMPFNGEHAERHPDWSTERLPRHWYFPIVFPEHEYAAGANDASTTPDHASCPSTEDAGLRKIHLHSWRDELALGPFTSEAVDAPSRWQPVSRRRFRGKGWHIDVGPGFPNDGLRHETGHPFQCVVLLLLLTDSDAGAGGTVMIPGSHRMVGEKLRCQGAAGMSHEDLNAWCVEQVLEAIKAGNLAIRDSNTGGGVCAALGRVQEQREAPDPLALPREARQIVGKAGDVVLMHPLVVHCGSTNLSSRVRIMGNGMVRMKRSAFEQRGGMLFAPQT
jgi:hypothetical protein